ncbi:hypothetical protein yc1106_07190 [Curvularia clavata]|uniref:Uncharacterized protein n=1 Tax=Curvularia clavata TaxID=95742 RepID=A0A9Q8ZB50_CURCL|nr:hypothetical protein yc1106_07190 [Curvularia clavata]
MLYDATRDQKDVLECVARGELEEVRGAAFFNRTSTIISRFCEIGDGVDTLEGYVHSLWHMYFRLSQRTSHETSGHDRLVLDILRIQGLGTLRRASPGLYGTDIARTAEGELWVDLPFLVTDMTAFWVDNCASMSGMHRLNFASFLAKLASTRVSKDRLCQIVLILFRSTFEEGRDLRTTDKDDEDTNRSLAYLDIAHLLPAACEWMKEAGHAIIELSDSSWHDCSNTVGQTGIMFAESELGKKRSSIGFTPWRYMFWLKRLHEIMEDATKANDEYLQELATDTIERMVTTVKERNSEILRAYRDSGDDLRDDKHLKCLEKESPPDE